MLRVAVAVRATTKHSDDNMSQRWYGCGRCKQTNQAALGTGEVPLSDGFWGLYRLVASVYRYVPNSAIAVPNLVLSVSLLPKKTTDVPMMTTLFTTLHTPCETGVTRDRVLKANCTDKTIYSVH